MDNEGFVFKTKLKQSVYTMTSYKVKWQEQKPFGYLSAFKSVQQFSSLCRSLARYFLSYIFYLVFKRTDCHSRVTK